MESQDELADCMGERAHGAAADLHDGVGRGKCGSRHRPGLRGFAILVTQRTIPCVCMGPALWTGSSRGQRHLRDGHRQQTMGTADARRGTQRFSLVVARRTAHCFPIESHRKNADLDHAGRRQRTTSTDDCRGQFAAELEFQVSWMVYLAALTATCRAEHEMSYENEWRRRVEAQKSVVQAHSCTRCRVDGERVR